MTFVRTPLWSSGKMRRRKYKKRWIHTKDYYPPVHQTNDYDNHHTLTQATFMSIILFCITVHILRSLSREKQTEKWRDLLELGARQMETEWEKVILSNGKKRVIMKWYITIMSIHRNTKWGHLWWFSATHAGYRPQEKERERERERFLIFRKRESVERVEKRSINHGYKISESASTSSCELEVTNSKQLRNIRRGKSCYNSSSSSVCCWWSRSSISHRPLHIIFYPPLLFLFWEDFLSSLISYSTLHEMTIGRTFVVKKVREKRRKSFRARGWNESKKIWRVGKSTPKGDGHDQQHQDPHPHVLFNKQQNSRAGREKRTQKRKGEREEIIEWSS